MKINYDSEYDILAIHKGFSKDESFKGNIDIGDLILDVSTKGKVCGIEVLNATDFLGILELIRMFYLIFQMHNLIFL